MEAAVGRGKCVKNHYEINGSLVWIRLDRRNKPAVFAMVDTAVLPKLLTMPVKWVCQWVDDSKTFYAYVNHPKLYLHRFLTEAPRGMEVDHKNHNGLDNRISNLRLVTRSENQQNRGGSRKGSKSGVRGVHWYSKDHRWHVRRMVNGVTIKGGSFPVLEDACEAARKLFLEEK